MKRRNFTITVAIVCFVVGSAFASPRSDYFSKQLPVAEKVLAVMTDIAETSVQMADGRLSISHCPSIFDGYTSELTSLRSQWSSIMPLSSPRKPVHLLS